MELVIDKFYENNLQTDRFARMLDDTTQCYKFYWLDAIMSLLAETSEDLTFDEIVNEMIYSAWYSVTEYHLRLGPPINGKSENHLEHAVHVIENDINQKSPKKCDIIDAIKKNEKVLHKDKDYLVRNVPYRLLSTFLDEVGGNDSIWNNHTRLILVLTEYNRRLRLPYTIIDGKGLDKRIHIDHEWKNFLQDNYSTIRGWIKLKKVKYLQDRNPGVPGIIYKVDSEYSTIRKLNDVRNLWETVEKVTEVPIIDTYTGSALKNDLTIDHFIPWSYVANDELWNLAPIKKATNSSKGNRLPEWKKYFPLFSNCQYYLYKMIYTYEPVKIVFKRCCSNNLNTIWAIENLYNDNNTEEIFKKVLEHNLYPIYESARLQGFGLWRPS